MSRAALLVEVRGGIIADASVAPSTGMLLLPGVAAALKRFNERGVMVIGVSTVDGPRPKAEEFAAVVLDSCRRAGASLDGCMIADAQSPASWRPPRPGLLLAAARRFGFDSASSWMIGMRLEDAQAAAQAGCAGAVLLGGCALPQQDLGIVVAAALDLADAPRVMIPRQGGCWHG